MKVSTSESKSNVYFAVFLFLAILGAFVIWKSSQWSDSIAQQRVLPSAIATSDSEAVIYGRRGTIVNKEGEIILLQVRAGGQIDTMRVLRGKKTLVWHAVIGENIAFSQVEWDMLKTGDQVYAVAETDIGGQKEIEASKIYRIEVTGQLTGELPETLDQDLFGA